MSLDLQSEVEAVFRRKMVEFLEWSKGNWKITEKDVRSEDWAADKSRDYIEGYNAAIDGMADAFACWNEEFGP